MSSLYAYNITCIKTGYQPKKTQPVNPLEEKCATSFIGQKEKFQNTLYVRCVAGIYGGCG